MTTRGKVSRIAWAVPLVVVSLLVPASTASAAAQPPAVPGHMVRRTFTNAAGTRTYYLYVPTTGGAGKPLMIWLHGCGGPGPMAVGTALARVAEERGFSLAYPVQDAAANTAQCWNWFAAKSQQRGSGEASILAGITTSVRDELGSDARRVYVGGYSAGGAMTTVMGATYPDVYAAIAPSAGAPYAAFDRTGQRAYQAMGPRARPMPVFILQGVTDELSNYAVGRANVFQWLGTDDYADDGAANSSVPRVPTSTKLQVLATTPPLPVLVELYRAHNCDLAHFLTSPYEHLVNGALFYGNVGLDLQRLMMTFLLAHRIGVVHQGCG